MSITNLSSKPKQLQRNNAVPLAQRREKALTAIRRKRQDWNKRRKHAVHELSFGYYHSLLFLSICCKVTLTTTLQNLSFLATLTFTLLASNTKAFPSSKRATVGPEVEFLPLSHQFNESVTQWQKKVQKLVHEEGQKELKFIHITKTGGTSIEMTGKRKRIYWGMFHKEYGWWHEVFPHKKKSLKWKYDWFLVVRNPWTRIVSEANCKWGGIGRIAEAKEWNREQLNDFVIRKVLSRNQIQKYRGVGDHYTEQYKYLDFSQRIHVIRFERLEEEFNSLMNKYHLPVKVRKHFNMGKNTFNLSIIDEQLEKLVKEVYKDDFHYFGYPMDLMRD